MSARAPRARAREGESGKHKPRVRSSVACVCSIHPPAPAGPAGPGRLPTLDHRGLPWLRASVAIFLPRIATDVGIPPLLRGSGSVMIGTKGAILLPHIDYPSLHPQAKSSIERSRGRVPEESESGQTQAT